MIRLFVLIGLAWVPFSGAAAAPLLEITPSALDFGGVRAGSVALDSLVFRNDGDEDVLLGTLIIENGPDFSVGGQGGPIEPGTTIAPGDSLWVPVAFRPPGQGAFVGTLLVPSNDPASPEQVVPLAGSGASGPLIELTATSFNESLDFGDTLTRELGIRNVGDLDLDWFLSAQPVVGLRSSLGGVRILWDRTHGQGSTLNWSILVSEAESRGAIVDELTTGSIDASALGPYRIFICQDMLSNWTPAERTALKAWTEAGGGILLIGDNDSTVPRFNDLLGELATGITMTFTDARAEVVITSSGITGHETTADVSRVFVGIGVKEINTVMPGESLVRDRDDRTIVAVVEIDVGRIAVVSDELFNDITIGEAESPGNSAHNRLLGNQILDWLAGGFWLQPDPGAGTLAPAESTLVLLHFDATELLGGTFEALLQIESNDEVTPSVDIPVTLSVTGAPGITTVPTSMSFGTIPEETGLSDSVLVINSGSEILDVTGIASSIPTFVVTDSLSSLDPGDSMFVVVTFLPESIGEFNANLTFTSNAVPDSVLTVPLIGHGGVNCELPCVAPSLRPIDAAGSHAFEFWMDIQVDSSPNAIQSFGFELNYDGSHLSFVDETRAGDIAPGFVVFAIENEPGRLTCGGFGTTAIPASSSGSLLQLRFTVDCDTCSLGDQSDFWVDSLVDDLVGIRPCCGELTLSECPTGHGDVNADSILSATDALCALKIFTNGGSTPADTSCDVNGDCEPAAADVNCDGNVTPSDALAIYERVLCVADPVPVACFAQGAPSPCSGSPRSDPGGLFWGTPQVESGTVAFPLRSNGRLGVFGIEVELPPGVEFVRVEAGPGSAWTSLEAGRVPGGVRIGAFVAGTGPESGLGASEIARLIVRGEGVLRVRDSWDADFTGPRQVALPGRAAPIEGIRSVHPNPTRGALSITYAAYPGRARRALRIHDVAGRVVRGLPTETSASGTVTVVWDGRDDAGLLVSAGVYFVALRLEDDLWTKKVLLVR